MSDVAIAPHLIVVEQDDGGLLAYSTAYTAHQLAIQCGYALRRHPKWAVAVMPASELAAPNPEASRLMRYFDRRIVSRYAGVPVEQVAAAESCDLGEVREARRRADRCGELGCPLISMARDRAPAADRGGR